jgi:hypothetical protein
MNGDLPRPERDQDPVLMLARAETEVGTRVEASVSFSVSGVAMPDIAWSAEGASVEQTLIANEAIIIAPEAEGKAIVKVNVRAKDREWTLEAPLRILPAGALKKTALVLFEVDTNTLKGVYVDASHPKESFTPPLKIKGTFRLDEATGDAFAGGSWPLHLMYDDGTHGDKVAGDGIWSIAMNFEKTDAKVYFAFDDSSPYRVQFESGLTWRFKLAWIDLDDFPDDRNDPAFIPDADKTIRWTAEMAEKGGIYGAPK